MKPYLLSVLFCGLLVAADSPQVEQKPARHVETADRLLVREAQLSLAEAHIARLQAVASVRVAEDQITDLLTTLRTRYSCPGCQLNNDLTWIPPKPAEAKGQAPSAAPAPSTASGQTSDKE